MIHLIQPPRLGKAMLRCFWRKSPPDRRVKNGDLFLTKSFSFAPIQLFPMRHEANLKPR